MSFFVCTGTLSEDSKEKFNKVFMKNEVQFFWLNFTFTRQDENSIQTIANLIFLIFSLWSN